jgi:CelD/BcsL family acetyltransferase involved in cellulose biosynthesis
MPAGDEFTLRIIGDADGFFALEEQWNRLAFSGVRTVFLTHPWLATWLKVRGSGYVPHVLTAWSADRLVAALPLVTAETGERIRRLRFMGFGALTPNHLDVVAAPDDRERAVRLFASSLLEDRSSWDVLEFDKLAPDTGTASFMSSAAAAGGLRSTTAIAGVSPYADLPATFDAYIASLSKSTRRHLRQDMNRIQRLQPPARFERVETEDGLDRAMEALERMHQARWQRKGYSGVFARPEDVRFHRSVTRQLLHSGHLRMYTLSVGEEIIAVKYGFRIADTFEAYVSSFDEERASLGPSRLLVAHAIEQSILEGATRFDYLEGAEPYKYAWCPQQMNDLRLRVYNRTVAGRLAELQEAATEETIALARRFVSPQLREALIKRMGGIGAPKG